MKNFNIILVILIAMTIVSCRTTKKVTKEERQTLEELKESENFNILVLPALNKDQLGALIIANA